MSPIEPEPFALWPILLNQGAYLSVLAQTPPGEIKSFVDHQLLPALAPVEVLHNASGLVMIPARDTAQGTVHHLGEALVSEARVRIGDTEGFGACLGNDLQQALAVAIVDATIRSGRLLTVVGPFLESCLRQQELADADLRARVEATRVEMETF